MVADELKLMEVFSQIVPRQSPGPSQGDQSAQEVMTGWEGAHSHHGRTTDLSHDC